MADFPKVGLHLDLRVQVPPLPALRRIAREAADFGVNTLIMEWEASFPFDRHSVLSGPRAYTPREVSGFIDDCARWGLDVIPLQQCFGHVEYILRHHRYASLRESQADLCQVCPCRIDEAVRVFSGIFAEVAALHPSPYFHLGGDETYLLGECPACRERAATIGKSRLYVDYIRHLAREVIRLGRRPLLWIDMLLKHPDAAAEMPPECIFVDWNYGWPVDRFGDFAGVSALPFEFWGAVAMRSAPDNHSSHAWVAHLDNLGHYIPVARQMKFQGIVMTSWSTSGVYGYEWELPGRPLALHPVRRVTPHAGLRVLMAAFAEAVRSDAPLDGPAFLLRYARERFGFSGTDAAAFRDAILLADRSQGWENLRPHGPRDAARALESLSRLVPARHATEFARYRLMVALTVFQDRVAALEASLQSEDHCRRGRPRLARSARALLAEGEALEKDFLHLYAGELHPCEFEEESSYRLKRVRTLVERICGRDLSASVSPPSGAPSPELETCAA